MDSRYREIELSKSLSWLLRHGAVKEGLPISDQGYIAVDVILKHKSFKKYTRTDVEQAVRNNSKQRFKLQVNPHTNVLEIKANQGHSISIVDTGLIPITEQKFKTIVHGTYFKCWPQIKAQGLSCMNRKHIHFAKGTLQDPNIISGIRRDVEVYIFINLEKALESGLRFYQSENEVILTSGNEKGFLEPQFFSKVTAIKTGEQLYP